jgi:hypothetical protein
MKAFITFDGARWDAKDGVGIIAYAYDEKRHGSGRVELFEKLRKLGYDVVVIDGKESTLVPIAA